MGCCDGRFADGRFGEATFGSVAVLPHDNRSNLRR